jgi:hypothetical protein
MAYSIPVERRQAREICQMLQFRKKDILDKYALTGLTLVKIRIFRGEVQYRGRG